MRISKYIKSFRLRTLPLSISGIILGSCLAAPQWRTDVFILAIATTLVLQILTNLCNELGDAQRGTDTEQDGRVAYGLQAGEITIKEMKNCIWVFIFLATILGSALIYVTFGNFFCLTSLIFIALGAIAIAAAITYTLGKRPYGYHAMGDLSVFIFFGLVSTIGAYYLQAQSISTQVILAACALGLPIVGVLNINNMRDMTNDLTHNKITFASKIGLRNAKIYQTLLIIGSLVLFAISGLTIAIAFFPLWTVHIYCVWKHNGKELDKQMPLLSFSTLALSIVCGLVFAL